MVVALFAEQHVKTDGLRTLRREFLDEPAINLSRPVKPEFITERAIFYGGDTRIFHGDEGEIGRGGRREIQGRPHAQVVSCTFQPLKKIEAQQPHSTDERKDENRQNDRRAFERFEFHRIELNKKPEQLKAALVLKKVNY
jgi:hypothetical protein